MGRFDVKNQLSAAQVFTDSAVVTTNSMEKKNAAQDLGIGQRQLGLVIFPSASATGGATYTADVIEADNAALTSNPTVIGTRTFGAGELTKGKGFFVPLLGYKMSKKYYGGRITPAGGTSPSVALDIYFGSEDDVANFKSFNTPYKVDN